MSNTRRGATDRVLGGPRRRGPADPVAAREAPMTPALLAGNQVAGAVACPSGPVRGHAPRGDLSSGGPQGGVTSLRRPRTDRRRRDSGTPLLWLGRRVKQRVRVSRRTRVLLADAFFSCSSLGRRFVGLYPDYSPNRPFCALPSLSTLACRGTRSENDIALFCNISAQ